MKFEKHLQKTETSEWKKAYIDYRGLKKLIKELEISRKGHDFYLSDVGTSFQRSSFIPKSRRSEVDLRADELSLERSEPRFQLPPFNFSVVNLSVEPSHEIAPEHKLYPSMLPVYHQKSSNQTSSFDISSSESGHGLASFSVQSDNMEGFKNPLAELPLHEILSQLMPKELAFFAMLDAELGKVESFYLAREKEMMARSFLLLNQLEELEDHRKMFLETNNKGWAASIVSSLSSRIRPRTTASERRKGKALNIAGGHGSINSLFSNDSLAKDKNLFFVTTLSARDSNQQGDSDWTSQSRHPSFVTVSPAMPNIHPAAEQGRQKEDYWNSKAERPHLSMSNDPSSYIHAKKKLERAVLEHYRGLETLHNYRVLNITGFRKAVKKFEKLTRIHVQQQYMAEKVANCEFASGEAVRNMTREIENIYAAAFVHGDKKKALSRLRASRSFKSHHFSTFRSGLLIGLAIAVLIDGLVKVFQPETQQAIPYWDILLFLYGLFLIPVLYSFLLGINLLVWARSRINYIFIFDLNVSTRLDYRQYFEIPSLLLATLCFAFWASFSRIGVPILQISTWLLVWLTFAALLLVQPVPVMAKSSRYWLIKTVFKLFLSGIRPVEFADFWMGDQLCSFIFTLSNTSLFICTYLDNFSDDWKKCKNSSRTWPIAFGLASIPFIIRLTQSIKRYVDTKAITHLINAGKYGTGIVSYLFYFMWSHQQDNRGTVFALWCVFNTCYSIYACFWDFLVDYSILQPHSKHPFLRTELMYIDHQWVYYLAMVSNLLFRFTWVIYIPEAGPSMMVRTFITGMFEMLRRIQWNFYRLENEHVGNTDQYRVTREMPLPYTFDFESREEDRDDDDTLTGKR